MKPLSHPFCMPIEGGKPRVIAVIPASSCTC
jgi:hypothetical protein